MCVTTSMHRRTEGGKLASEDMVERKSGLTGVRAPVVVVDLEETKVRAAVGVVVGGGRVPRALVEGRARHGSDFGLGDARSANDADHIALAQSCNSGTTTHV